MPLEVVLREPTLEALVRVDKVLPRLEMMAETWGPVVVVEAVGLLLPEQTHHHLLAVTVEPVKVLPSPAHLSHTVAVVADGAHLVLAQEELEGAEMLQRPMEMPVQLGPQTLAAGAVGLMQEMAEMAVRVLSL